MIDTDYYKQRTSHNKRAPPAFSVRRSIDVNMARRSQEHLLSFRDTLCATGLAKKLSIDTRKVSANHERE